MQLTIATHSRVELVDITSQVAAAVADSGCRRGLAHLFVQHTTAGITINENADPDVVTDILAALARQVPDDGPYRHGEGNSPAHVKASLMGFSLAVPIREGAPALGTWQGIYLCEFDGPRRRRLLITVVPVEGTDDR